MTKYHHSLLWPNATTFERSQRGYLQPKSATVPCDQRPPYSRSLSSAAAVLMPLATSFLVAWVPAAAAAGLPVDARDTTLAAAATNLQNSNIPFKYIHCCIKIVLECTTAAHSTTMSGTSVFHSAQCVTIATTSSIECSTEKGSKPASYKSQGAARLEILQFEWNHNLKYDKRVDHCNILNGPPATIVQRLCHDNAYFSIVTDWNRVFHSNLSRLTGP